MYDDWDLIEASFATQYPQVDLYAEEDMDYKRFCTLLSGIMPETPLGQIVSIRSETNKEIIKAFTPEQKRIRNEWLSKEAERASASMTEEEKVAQLKELQNIFAKAFG